MTTGIKDPFKPNRVHYPCQHMPSVPVTTEELEYKGFIKQVVTAILEKMIKMLPTMPAPDDEDIVEGDEGHAPDTRSPELVLSQM